MKQFQHHTDQKRSVAPPESSTLHAAALHHLVLSVQTSRERLRASCVHVASTAAGQETVIRWQLLCHVKIRIRRNLKLTLPFLHAACGSDPGYRCPYLFKTKSQLVICCHLVDKTGSGNLSVPQTQL